MTLLLTWVAPDGIVMGADSAITFTDAQDKTRMTLADAYKIVPYDREGLRFGVSFFGLAKIASQWTTNWLREYVTKCRAPKTIYDFAQQLAADLNALGLKGNDTLGMHIAGWEIVARTNEGIEPRFFEVANSASQRYFSVEDILGKEVLADIRKYRAGDRSVYPMRFGSAGVPESFSTEWIANFFLPVQTRMLGVQVPQPDITSVSEYVRFLIGMVADLQRVARQHATVNRPIETFILFPDLKSIISTRY